MNTGERGKRGWWRLAVLLAWVAMLAAAFAYAWWFKEGDRQEKLMRTGKVLLVGFAGALLWMVFVSGWKARVRWSVLGGTVAVMIFCALALRITGVTGDLVPIVEWRWTKRPGPALVSGPTQNPANNAAGATNVSYSFPQFLGPNRDGTVSIPALARNWSQSPPQELWRRTVGPAWSGFAMQGQRAITQEQHGENETVICYDLLTGQELWKHSYASRYATTVAGEGPRATPTISGNRVYTLGGAGVMSCLDLETGRVIWTKDTIAEHKATVPQWGVACSPLVLEHAVLVTAGGNATLVAYDKNDGSMKWKAGAEEVYWSSPTRVTLAGRPQIVLFSGAVTAYDEHTGKRLWQHEWRNPYPQVSVPLVISTNRLLVSQGYGGGSELIEISAKTNGFSAERVWKSIRMKSKFGTLLQTGGYVYGLDDGALACIDPADGKLQWKGDRYGHGQMLLAGELIVLMAESGHVVLVEPNPTEQREIARHKVFNAKTWNPPALSGDLLLVRNDREAACLRLPLATR